MIGRRKDCAEADFRSFVYTRGEVETCLELARRGKIVPLVYEIFPLAEARAAMETMERREQFGKIVLKP